MKCLVPGRVVLGSFAVVALLGFATSCSSGGSAKSAGTSPPATRAATSTTTAETNPAAKALAKRAVLKLSDFPPGWTSSPSTGGSAKVDKQLSDCFHITSPHLVPGGASADSDDFTSPSQQTITNTVGVAPSTGDVTKVMDILSGANASTCFTEAVNTALAEGLKSTSSTLPKGTTIGNATVSPESFNSLGDRTVAYQASVPVTTDQGFNANVYVDLIFVQQGRAAVLLSAEDTLTPFPPDTSASLIRKVLARLPRK
jgi:hypothetical protein